MRVVQRNQFSKKWFGSLRVGLYTIRQGASKKGQTWVRQGSDMGQARVRQGSGKGQTRVRQGSGKGQTRIRQGSDKDQTSSSVSGAIRGE